MHNCIITNFRVNPFYISDPNCKDSGQQCALVIQSALCHHKYFKEQCCHSCLLQELKKKQARERAAASSIEHSEHVNGTTPLS